MWQQLKEWARQLKAETLVLWFCCRHHDTPMVAKIAATLVVAYALSPIDLIPDFIPVFGYLDDLLLIPLGIWLTLKLIPQRVLDECGVQARTWLHEHPSAPRNYFMALLIIALWIGVLWFIAHWLMTLF
jgi:uncharacterized membrane protein YkvA (DUF1232 family)